MIEMFLKILNMSISASWLVLAVVLLRLFLKKVPKWINVALWGFVCIRLVVPFYIESVFSLVPSAETISLDILLDPTPAINTGIPVLNNAINPAIIGSLSPNPRASANPLQIWMFIFTNIWIAGIVFMLAYSAISYWLLWRRVATAVPMEKDIYQCETVVSPFVLGLIRPRIYLPFYLKEQDITAIVAHERAHIDRHDYLWKPLGFLLLTVHWFNPLMWLAYILLCRDIELACDEKVIKKLSNEQRIKYSEVLLACSVNRGMIATCPLAFGEVGVKERVKNIMSYKKPSFWIIIVAVIACVVTAFCFLTNPKEPDINLKFNVTNLTDEEFGRVGTHEVENATKDDFKNIELVLEVKYSDKISDRTIKMPNIMKILKDEGIYWFGSYITNDNPLKSAYYEDEIVVFSRGLDEQAIKNLFSFSEVKVSWTTNKGENKERVFNLSEVIRFK